ncbi:MAG: hypothetical protein JWL68_4129 [Actinomycetia bacterium]|nr:hypothetical protein [Actinomycetes bacterium]
MTAGPTPLAAWRERRQQVSGGWPHRWLVGMLAALAGAGYSVYCLARYHTFHYNAYDLVIFDQAVRSYAHFRPGISVIKGVHNGFGPDFSVLGDHWSPILASLAPLYWLHDNPQTLLVAQSVLFALAIPPLWVFTRRALGGGPQATAAAYLVSLAYGLSWPVAEAARAGFHEVAFAPVLTAVALERLQAGRVRGALIALGALLLVKEDMGLLVAGIGAALALSRPGMVPRQRLVAAGLIVAGLADTVLATQVLIPAMGGRSDYYWAYTELGSNGQQALVYLITHPVGALRLLVSPRVKLDTVLWLFGAFCFLPLLSPLSLAAVPLLAERMLGAKFPNWWTTHYQYNAYLVIILACAAVDGAARLSRWSVLARRRLAVRRGPSLAGPQPAESVTGPAVAGSAAWGRVPAAGRAVALGCAAALCAAAVLLVPRFPLAGVLHPSFYHRNARMTAAAAAVSAVPDGVTVEAAGGIGPHLSARDTVLLWDGENAPRWEPWVVADVGQREFTFASIGAEKQRVALLRRHGYLVTFDRKGYIVLHRDSAQPGAGPSQASAG